jgi:poly(A)-specific ribonuclease
MQVNRKNFEKLLPSILKDIKSADFIAIDSEFTGLGVKKSDRNDILDTIQDRYQKVSSVASSYLPIQVGLALFHFSEITKQYVAKPFNFYIFPRTGNKCFGLDRAFQAQVSSIEFLESCGFKWNEWVENGISYVNVEDYERIKFRLNKPNEVDLPLQQGDSLYDYSVEIEDKLKDFLQNSTKKSIDIPTLSGQHKRVVNHLVVRLYCIFYLDSMGHWLVITKEQWLLSQNKQWKKEKLILIILKIKDCWYVNLHILGRIGRTCRVSQGD